MVPWQPQEEAVLAWDTWQQPSGVTLTLYHAYAGMSQSVCPSHSVSLWPPAEKLAARAQVAQVVPSAFSL
jgi:hypothetical protein